MHHGPEFTVVLIAGIALAIGAAMRLVSSRTRFPYTILMLLVGLASGLLLEESGAGHSGIGHRLGQGAFISSDLIIFVFLPALIFESAYAIEVHEFKKNVGAVLVLAVPALVVSTVLVALLMIGLTGPAGWQWGWSVALVFGALISATDPVAVVAILRELGVSKRLGILIEGESLLNDGTSIVVFSVLLALLTGEVAEFSTGDALLRFAQVVAGGVAVGAILAFILSKWIERLFNDPLAEITLTLVLAYAAMIVAEGLLHVSGVMAVVVSGLWMGGEGKTKISPEVSHFLHRFWEMLGYVANTLIFFLVGLVIATQAEHAAASDFALIGVAYLGIMAIRFLLTYAFQPAVNRLSEGVTAADSAVVAWGGLRGAVSLALALVVSQNSAVDPELRRQVLLVTAGVVFLTILVNGTTIGKLLARLGYDKPPLGEQLAHLTARSVVLDGVRASIDEIGRSRDLRTVSWGDVNARLEERQKVLEQGIGAVREELAAAPRTERVAGYWSRVLGLERQAYWEAFAHGTLGATAVKMLSQEVDLQLDRLAHGELDPPNTRAPVEGLGRGLSVLFGPGSGTFEHQALIYDLSRAEALAAEKVLTTLDSLRDIEPEVRETIRETYRGYLRAGKERIEDMRANLPEMAAAIEKRLAQRIELNFEREGYENLAHRGVLDEAAAEGELRAVEERMRRLALTKERVPIPETAELVASTPLFSQLGAAALRELAEITEEMVLPAGEYLFRENDRGDSLFVIARGAVHVVVDDTVVDVLGGGDIIGEISLLTGAPRTASIRAATAVTLGKITRERFNRLMDANPVLRDEVWQAFARRSFDNAVRGRSRFAHLDRRARRDWIDAGLVHALEPGETAGADAAHRFLFVLLGRVELGGEPHSAPALVDLGDARVVKALEAARVVLLAEPPSLEAQAPPSEAGNV